MYGIELAGLFRFFIQLNLVLAGATSLWCFVFLHKAKKASAPEQKENWYRLSFGLNRVLIAALLLFIISWWVGSIFVFTPEASGHEGVVHSAAFSKDLVQKGFQANLPWVSILTIFNAAALLIFFIKDGPKKLFWEKAHIFLGVNTALLSIILALSAFNGGFNKEQIALVLHNWHSIITLGTVLCVDILFLLTIKSKELKKTLYPFYPIMSAGIWLGLGLDFIASFLLLDNGFPGAEQFIFNQAVVIILILNGALLSVGVNDALIRLVESRGEAEFEGLMDKVVRVSGSVSIVSWVTVTFIDFFVIPLSFVQLGLAYLVLIFIAYLVKPGSEKLMSRFAL